MGVLRIKEDIDKMAELDEIIRRDPYELFTLDEPHRITRRMRPELLGAVFVGVVVAFFVAFATLWGAQKDSVGAAEPYAYFEVKVIDAAGRPVAAAKVSEGDRELGVTDSFGEWRRFMRVQLGGTVALDISKKIGANTLTAVKNLAVPGALPGGGDLEIAGTVQLVRGGVNATPVAKAATVVPVRAPVALAPVIAAPAPLPATALSAAGFTSIWLMADNASPRLEGVVAALRRRARELGLKVEPQSAFRLEVSELNTAGGTLIQVEGTHADGAERQRRFSFLRNYQTKDAASASADAMPTARDILWSTINHAQVPYVAQRDGSGWTIVPPAAMIWAQSPGRTLADASGRLHRLTSGAGGEPRFADSPCAEGTESCTVWSPGIARLSPVPAWQRLPLKVHGTVTAGTDLYVSGYAVAIDALDGQATYWGLPGAAANLTVVKGGRITARKKIEAGATVPFVALAAAPSGR